MEHIAIEPLREDDLAFHGMRQTHETISHQRAEGRADQGSPIEQRRRLRLIWRANS